MTDFPVDLEAEHRENQHRQQAEQEGQMILRRILKVAFFITYISKINRCTPI